jgi:antitoxin StbD
MASRISGDQPDATCRSALATCSETCLAVYNMIACLPGPLVAHLVLIETAVSISDHKKNPMAIVAAGEGMAVAVLNRNEPAFYGVPARAYDNLMDLVDDLELGRLADARKSDGQEPVQVSLDALCAGVSPGSLREWRKLTPGIREQFKNKPTQWLTEPRISRANWVDPPTAPRSSCVPPGTAWSMGCVTTSSWPLSWPWASGSARLAASRPTSPETNRRTPTRASHFA